VVLPPRGSKTFLTVEFSIFGLEFIALKKMAVDMVEVHKVSGMDAIIEEVRVPIPGQVVLLLLHG
jgi:hypothetical protein